MSRELESAMHRAAANRGAIDVLHVVQSFFPDSSGGTEVHIATLITALSAHGLTGAVAVPGFGNSYDCRGIRVFPFSKGKTARFASVYSAPNDEAAEAFRELLGSIRPRVVHLHSYTSDISELLVDAAQDVGAKTVFTYHMAAMSCARGTMLLMGKSVCDGRLEVRRCTKCTLEARDVSGSISSAIALLPPTAARLLCDAGLTRGPLESLRLPAVMATKHGRFNVFIGKLDKIVALSRWAADVLRQNHVSETKLVLCPNGASSPMSDVVRPTAGTAHDTVAQLKIGYFGRLHPTKGVDLLIDALHHVPDAPVRLDIYGLQGPESYVARLAIAATGEQRIAFLPAVPPHAVTDAMRGYDFVAIPSRWVENAPMVALESLAAGTPLLGARIGGIAEIVRDDVDGVLVTPDDARAWGSAISALAHDPRRVAKLRAAVRPPRAMGDVAAEMSTLYDSLNCQAAR
jgi:glycosyltransferase involved in cell wall biosynthesis